MPLAGSRPTARASAAAEAMTFVTLVAGRWREQEGAFSKDFGPMTSIRSDPSRPRWASAAQAADSLTPSPLAGEGWGEGV